eukprot:COSAG01_NODE_26267_length_719_cov_1.232258_1_plen_61_part_10
MYLEPSSSALGDVSYLVSPRFRQMSRLSFYYHMYGATMGVLSVEMLFGGSSWLVAWSRTGP